MDYTIRKATASDRDLIYGTKKDSIFSYVDKIWGWDETFQRTEFDRDFSDLEQFEIIEADDRFAGFVQSCVDDGYVDLCEIHLLPDFQGRGIGSAIIQKMISAAEQVNQPVCTGCFKENHRAKALYLRLGFSQIGETETHYVLRTDPAPKK